MQMIFQRSAAVTARVIRPQPRRGSFALEPVQALPRLAARIEALAERAVETNPFFLPAFLEPALRGLGRRGLKLAIFSDRSDLRFFAPVVSTGAQIFGRPQLRVWTHPYAPLGTPLIDSGGTDQVAEALLEHIKSSGRSVLLIPDLPLEGKAAAALRRGAAGRGFSIEAGRQARPVLIPPLLGGLPGFDAMVNQKRRRELDRQLRRMSEKGAVSFMSARTPSDVEAAFGMFAALEAEGWKGRRGTALSRRRAVHDFARVAVLQMAAQGHAAIDVLRVGEQPVAALIRFDFGGLSVPWKITYHERFAAYSPGKQLMCDETRRWLMDSTVIRVDPVCEEDNPLMAALWSERESYGTMILSPSRVGVAARTKAASIGLRSAAKALAKRIVAPGLSPPRGSSSQRRRRKPPRPPAT